jgi:hypothetical protein
MTFFWILWGFDALISLIVLYFLMVGLSDGSVSSSNMSMWVVAVLIIAVVLGGSLMLKNNYMMVAKILLWLMALPGLFYGLFLLIAVGSGARWN